VTLPNRESVQVTIYNSADLTLVRESRFLTLREGLNKLQFSWENTLIDPTSLSMIAKEQADKIDVFDLTFPPRVKNLGLWNIKSEVGGKVPFEITYLTSGLSWRAFYMGTLTADERTMRLQGYVRVTNNSGEDYENAQTRLIVGKVHLLDQIAALARRSHPFGRPGQIRSAGKFDDGDLAGAGLQEFSKIIHDEKNAEGSIKQIKKEGLSEYFLYTIEGTETIPHGWSKRLPSFDTADIPVVNLYKYEEQRYGRSVVRFLSFKNDEAHELGETPIPGGSLMVYRSVDEAAHLSYQGQSSFKYIPVDEDVELNLGAVGNVTVEPTLMDFKTDQYLFHNNGNITGWDEIRTFKVEVKNTREVAVKVQVDRNFTTRHGSLTKEGDFDEYEKIDLDTVRFKMKLAARSKKEFTYVLTTRHGGRENR
jgi:hypothetical protein